MKELIERLRNDCYQEDEVRAHAKEAADALERMEAERDSLKEGLDGWHARYLDCEVERDVEKEHVRQCVANIAELVAERDALRAGLAAALDFAGTVAGGASWWEDVWKEHEAAIAGEKK
jgi:uncharacterized coiled-coil DUF342 family protein